MTSAVEFSLRLRTRCRNLERGRPLATLGIEPMKLRISRALAPFACLALVACSVPGLAGSKKAPTGQVVATVEGEEITLSEVRAEMAGGPPPANAQAAKAMQEGALQQIIVRRLMAKAAEAQGLDKSPEFAIQKKRAGEALLAQALQRQLTTGIPAATRQDAESFISEHPTMFAERKVMTVDQIRMPLPDKPDELKALQPMSSLSEIEAWLNGKGIPFQRGASVIDTANTDPNIVAQLAKLPPGEPFIFPAGNVLLINNIRDTKSSPFVGDEAVNYAMGVVRNQRLQEAVSKGVDSLVKTKLPTIKYNDAFKPTRPLGAPVAKAPPPPPAAGSAPAPPPPALKP
jgi:EpsD family peptidyl-prolyl cis-trans isomerase